MQNASLLIIGSSNTDMVVMADHLPVPGETLLGGKFFMNAGGKGANQAVAAARAGGRVTFIAKTGNDLFGREAVLLFSKEGIDTSKMLMDPELPSGVALITVDREGENYIAVAPGANANLLPGDLDFLDNVLEHTKIVLMQLETPVETITWVAEKSKAKNLFTVLNPAPAAILPDELFTNISLITPNQKEAEMLTGIAVTDVESAKAAAAALAQKGTASVIITMGAMGSLTLHQGEFFFHAARKVKAVDSTAAGDVFNGALVTALAESYTMKEAVVFASSAAAISVTRPGAQSSAPTRQEILSFIQAS